MARTIDEIKKVITDRFIRSSVIFNLYSLVTGKTFEEQFSKSSVESIVFHNVATEVNTLENIFDAHKAEVSEIIANQKVPTERWYARMAKEFLYGVPIPIDSDKYDTTNLTEEQIQAAKIITNAAVVEYSDRLRIKVAKENSGKLAPLSSVELSAFSAYMQKVTPAGVRREITSGVADKLYLTLKVYVDPLVFDTTGKISGKEPVRDAIKAYLKKLPFNGVLVLAYLIDELQKIDGVVIPHVISAKGKYGEVETLFDVKYQPDAGYLDFAAETDLQITYELQNTIL